MRLIVSLLMLFPFLVFSAPSEPNISSKRSPHEPFAQALKRVQASVSAVQSNSLIARDTPIGKKVPIKQMDFTLVPTVVAYDEMMTLFKVVRDTRFLFTDDNPEFERRISWLYPDDGCFARAALSIIKLEKENLLKPAKIFAFGDLILQTSYSPDGYVSWWYHVSTAVNYMGSIYILDPALNPAGPLLVDEWYSKMGNEMELSGVICSSYTYGPFDNCYQVSGTSDERAIKDESRYLGLEWDRISSLGFDPITLLGNNPPWIVELSR
ncbi:protein-glutamine glutaminase family protein [Legionella bononiensis]|uniref:Protein glutaminase domain-containing protein n=1 Tax=Legionella bononiensis TaxID=2793102 RepID=A0ABS1WCF4_9GAMM|nr:protein-glutamine glutaminase family protein [Legionella bononiensis]MBL7478906.1 hypothetical protein [Legionella bononiensis]MBL7527038.1 hypothetical protein [Legionella bononiensis]MBL7562007.1 hypothetical protein [Legionella bononiensis]